MDRNVLIETLQNEGNLKHSFSAKDIELIAEHMSIKTFDKVRSLTVVLLIESKSPYAYVGQL